ncbi:MAG: hypothetical protein JWR55_1831 [Aeromicrobium sp.]|jgi:hypothetical protein|nr:hypothetical protein [Aeromicrobium sp.]
MGAVRLRRTADRANTVVSDLAARVDGRAVDVSTRAAQTIAVAVRLLRIPTAVIGALSIPFIVATLVLGAIAGGAVGVVILIAGIAMAIVNALFWARRGRVLAAVDDPAQLATELGIMLTMTGRVDEARGALTQIAGRGGWRVMGRLRGLWTGTQLTGKWIDDIGDLPRAKYFGPPKIGTTVSITFAALWLVPISIVVALFAAIGTLAGTL